MSAGVARLLKLTAVIPTKASAQKPPKSRGIKTAVSDMPQPVANRLAPHVIARSETSLNSKA